MAKLIILFAFSLAGIIGAICWPYAINTWLLWCGKSAVIVWWQGFLLGYVPGLGQAALPVAVLTWLVSLFM